MILPSVICGGGGEKRSLADECVRYANEVGKETKQETRNSEDTTSAEPEKEDRPWYKKIWAKIIGATVLLGAIATILILLFGDNILGRSSKDFKTNKPGTKQIETPKTETKTKTDIKVEDITLLYLFENDFNNLLRATQDRILSGKGSSQTTVKSKLYLDFESQTKFVGFYIPSVPETFDICSYLAEHYKMALELTSKTMVESSAIGLQAVNVSELNFSGRVFIYHEYPLLEAQKRELFALYKKHRVSPQFRGGSYLFKKKQIGRPR